MYTDWVLAHRLALELSSRYLGARVQAAGQLTDGRFALQLWQRGTLSVVAFDVFAMTPVVTVESVELGSAPEPGFIRRAAAALRGMTIESVQSRKGDRVLRMEFGSRSRFGVENGYTLIAELVPKFGNLLLIKEQTIVSALKEFAPSDNAQRSVAAGDAYEPPPLFLQPSITEGEFIRALDTRDRSALPNRATVAAFRGVVPLLPQMIALSLLTQAFHEFRNEPADSLGVLLMERADAFFVALKNVADSPVIVYREEGELVQAHITPLHQFADLQIEDVDELLPLLAESRSEASTAQQSDRSEKRRRALARTLKEREERVRKELRDADLKLQRATEREDLREEGRQIFATLHERSPDEQEIAKADAAALFARYHKLGASIPHVRARQGELLHVLNAVVEMQWELERATEADLDDVAEAVKVLDGRTPAPVRKGGNAKRKPLSITTENGSRILIGRSPVENAELTFHIARPEDLWFHAQKIPGAHVILQRDDKLAPPAEDLQEAAALAAYYSKARDTAKVLVDYTQRKHVRKQPAAPPGLVFYTTSKSILVEPKAPALATAS